LALDLAPQLERARGLGVLDRDREQRARACA